MKETIEHNNRFYGEKELTEREQYEQWLKIANEEIERLNSIINEIIRMFDKDKLNKYYYGMSYEFEINDFKEDIFKIIKRK